jgi:DNA-binding transcriptional MerR regulator
MLIGELAKKCKCPVETIRYYEKIGLLPKPVRSTNRYRVYDELHRKWLQFILRSRSLGFTQDEVRQLVEIAHMKNPACADVHSILSEHVSQVQGKILDLRRLENALSRLNAKCEDGTLSECPVIDELMK